MCVPKVTPQRRCLCMPPRRASTGSFWASHSKTTTFGPLSRPAAASSCLTIPMLTWRQWTMTCYVRCSNTPSHSEYGHTCLNVCQVNGARVGHQGRPPGAYVQDLSAMLSSLSQTRSKMSRALWDRAHRAGRGTHDLAVMCALAAVTTSTTWRASMRTNVSQRPYSAMHTQVTLAHPHAPAHINGMAEPVRILNAGGVSAVVFVDAVHAPLYSLHAPLYALHAPLYTCRV